MPALLRSRLLLGSLVALSLACGGLQLSSAELAPAVLARDEAGQQPTAVFGPRDTFWCNTALSYAPDDTRVTAVWTLVSAPGIAAQEIDRATIQTGSAPLHFPLESDNPWPAGQYRVDLLLDDKPAQSLAFTVR